MFEEHGDQDMIWARLQLGIAKSEEIIFSEDENEYISLGMRQLKEQDKFEWIDVCLMWVDYYTNLGHLEKAMDYIIQAEELVKKVDALPFWSGRIHGNHHRICLLEDDLPGAREHLKNAIVCMKECRADGWVELYEKELAELS